MKNIIKAVAYGVFACATLLSAEAFAAKPFPYVMSDEKPDYELSTAMQRVYDQYGAATPQQNELYTQFRYSKLTGLDYHDHDGTVTRRDPSRIVRANGKYYIWYTLRNTPTTYMGGDKSTETIPSTDWDLCDIGYATSEDGFHWTEQGVAAGRPPKPNPGHRSVSTPEILVWKGKYYLYYQAFDYASGTQGGDDCPVAVSVADSPDGPWKATNQVVIPNGAKGDWDQSSIHDPHPIVYKGKIYLYYKSDYKAANGETLRSTGLAIADNPLGPFKKYEKNPVMSSGHETQMFRFKEGIAAMLAKDGHEANTIQYSPNGKDFYVASYCDRMPIASGTYDPDAFTDVEYAKGITWGIAHVNVWGPHRRSYMLRYDCDLRIGYENVWMKKNVGTECTPEEFLERSINKQQREAIIERMKKGEF